MSARSRALSLRSTGRSSPMRLKVMHDPVLGWIGGHDFQVAPLAERKQRVARAAAGMHSPHGRAHTSFLFHEIDSAIKIAATDNEVIEQGGHLSVVFRVRRPGNRRHGKRAAG